MRNSLKGVREQEEDELHEMEEKVKESCPRQEHTWMLWAQQGQPQGQGRAPKLGTANDPEEGCRDTDGLYSAAFCT